MGDETGTRENAGNGTRPRDATRFTYQTLGQTNPNSPVPLSSGCSSVATAMAQPGLLQWTNTVRLTMVEDYGRQFFKDQIQQQGFLFLEDYLDNILAASAKEDLLIDLVKTPGRKKMAKKVKLVPSKLNSMVLSARCKCDHQTALTPVSHQSTGTTDTETVPPSGIASEYADGDPFEKELHVAEEVTTGEVQVPLTNAPSPPSSSAIEQNKPVPIATSNSVHEPQTLNVVLPEQNELSVIVEGDEPADRSFAVATPARPDVPSHGVSLASIALDSKREGGISPSVLCNQI
ncbi:tat-binding protein [Salix suchowensis]|nr:tat-binding protein [Salix suchowensis]